MNASKSIIIVGAGHMGSAIALGLKRSSPHFSITVVEHDVTCWSSVTSAGICILETMPELKKIEALILAIPPQTFLKHSKHFVKIQHYAGLIISVMAGITISELMRTLNTTQVCRAMPNVPCTLVEGMTVFCCATPTTKENHALAQSLFSGLGKWLFVKDEKLLDGATALVGGGPAYVAYFAASLLEYARTAGFNEASASYMVIQLLRGTTVMLEQSGETPVNLCQKVMTAKGTTEQAIKLFDDKQLRSIIVDGLNQACLRSKALAERI